MYNIEQKIASKNGWFTPAEARAYYGRYDRHGITWHWWGDGTGASNHDNIVNYINNGAANGQKSVNYVLSDNKITLLVGPDNVAWTSQSGNATTISVELQPTLGAEGYKKAGWLASELAGRYGGDRAYYPHNYWFSTACPGTISLDRIRQEEDKWQRGEYNPNPQPPADTRPEWKKNLVTYASKTLYAIDDTTPLRNLENTQQVIKGFAKGTPFEIAGETKVGNYPYYLTRSAINDGRGNGFDFYELQATDPNAPVADNRPESEKNKKPLPAVTTMYTLANAKLVDVNTMAVIKEYPLDTPMEIKGETSVSGKRFLLTTSSYDGNRYTGFLEGDLKLTITPTPQPEPEKPEWVKNLRDIDDTEFWVKEDTDLIDITTGKPTTGKDAKRFKKDDSFVASAVTVVGKVEYRITDYSFKKGIFNGVPIDKLTLTPPGVPDIDPIPQNPDLVDKNVVITFLEMIGKLISDFVANLRKK